MRIRNESVHHKDILQEPFIDSYNNLTLKSVYLLKHFVHQRTRMSFLLKVDDDSFVNILGLHQMLRNLKQKNNLLGKGLIGFVQKGLKSNHWLPTVHRPTTKSLQNEELQKWIVPRYMYRKRLFPQFLAGAGYLVARKDAQCLLNTSQIVSIIHLEDVYITGLCALKCNIRRIHHQGFKARRDAILETIISQSDVVLHYANESVIERLHQQTLKF